MGELEILARQGGLITRVQAIGLGLSSASVGRRVASKEWRAVLPGVYRHSVVGASAVLMVEATMLWLGPTAVISGAWAAWWHGFRAEPTGAVTVTVPLSSGARSRRHVCVRRRDLAAADVTVVRGVQVIRQPLAALENAELFDGQDVVDRALQRYVTVPALTSAMARFAHATGAAAARRSLDLVVDGTVSPPERTLAAALRAAGLHQVKAGVHVRVAGATYWVDFAVESIKLAIEIDGYVAHSDPRQFRKDRERQNALILDDWTVLRYTPWELRTDLPAVITEIAAVLATSG